MGGSKASQAVGGAVAANPVLILLACHRVLPKAGGLGGFSQGSETKRWLLELEGLKTA